MQIISLIIAVLLLIIFIFPISTGVHNLGMAAGVLLGLCFGAEGLFYNKMSFTAQRYTVFALFVVSLILIFACAYVMKFGKILQQTKNVNSFGMQGKGRRSKPCTSKRADAAYFYLLKNPDCVAILSGGQGKDENISEAACLKKLLTDRGIAQSRLFARNFPPRPMKISAFQRKLLTKTALIQALRLSQANIISSEQSIFAKKRLELCLNQLQNRADLFADLSCKGTYGIDK